MKTDFEKIPPEVIDLAKKMIELSGKENIDIIFTGIRRGEKLYEELLISDSDQMTNYESIMVTKKTFYAIDVLSKDIEELLSCQDKIYKLRAILPEFEYSQQNNN